MKTALLLLVLYLPLLAYTYHFIPEESWRTVSKVETKTTNKVMALAYSTIFKAVLVLVMTMVLPMILVMIFLYA
ncbi:MAG: hypothetical protein IPI60_05965 [Saprospiraceae bacterium]|nr:hypothetical protein [Saprospiraceae bacterium]